MRHLRADELVDLAEGTRAESDALHLRECESCRAQLTDMRRMMGLAAEVTVPEPSPLFWNHLSARVRDAVAAVDIVGQPARFGWLETGSWWWRVSAGSAVAALLVAIVVTRFASSPGTSSTHSTASIALTGATSSTASASSTPSSVLEPLTDDPSLSLVADLSADMDWDARVEAGLFTRAGGADRALAELTDSERQELHRLLKEALGKPGN